MVSSIHAGYTTRELAPAPAKDASRRKTARTARSTQRRLAIREQLLAVAR